MAVAVGLVARGGLGLGVEVGVAVAVVVGVRLRSDLPLALSRTLARTLRGDPGDRGSGQPQQLGGEVMQRTALALKPHPHRVLRHLG